MGFLCSARMLLKGSGIPGEHMSTTFKIKTAGNPLMKLFIDQTPLLLANHAAQVALAPGQYVLAWVVLGAPSDNYSVEITDPSSANWKISATLDSSGKDAGVHWVEL
jgi:hypothetical protein